MFGFVSMQESGPYLFDRPEAAEIAPAILQAILEARSPSLPELSHKIAVSPPADPRPGVCRRRGALSDRTWVMLPEVRDAPASMWVKP